MRNKTQNDIKKFVEAINACTHPVWVSSGNGKLYNAKDASEFAKALAAWAGDVSGQAEIYATGREDEAVMMRFYMEMCAA